MQIRVTPKQKDILDSLKQGESQRSIAKKLGCTSSNISQVVKTLQRKYPQLKLWREKHKIKEVFDLGDELN